MPGKPGIQGKASVGNLSSGRCQPAQGSKNISKLREQRLSHPFRLVFSCFSKFLVVKFPSLPSRCLLLSHIFRSLSTDFVQVLERSEIRFGCSFSNLSLSNLSHRWLLFLNVSGPFDCFAPLSQNVLFVTLSSLSSGCLLFLNVLIPFRVRAPIS